MSAPLTLLFNEAYRGTYQLIHLLRAAASPRRLVVHGTHSVSSTPFLQACDHAGAEPAATGADFVAWALAYCDRYGVDVFVPGREMLAAARAEAAFEAIGVRLMVSPAAAVQLLADKCTTYAAAPALGIAVPRWHRAETAAEVLAAHDALAADGLAVCVKPAVDHGAQGFRVIDPDADDPATLAAPPSVHITLERLLGLLERAGRFPILVVGELLEGPEWSVDCVSDGLGRLLVAVPRGKSGLPWTRELAAEPDVIALARAAVQGWGLRWLSNVQVRRRAGGEPVLLEVNTRASSGLYQSCASGVDLAWLALRLLLDGTEAALADGLPTPRLPVSLIAMTTAIPFLPATPPGGQPPTGERA